MIVNTIKGGNENEKKVITILAGAVLLSPISAALPNNIHTPQINKEASAKSKYKLESVESKNVSVKQQKKQDKDEAISNAILSLGIGGIPGYAGKAGSALLTALGLKGSIDQINKNYAPLTVKNTTMCQKESFRSKWRYEWI
ncbi:hypothetical protein AAHH64_11955 [Staphylococcus epidermidis]